MSNTSASALIVETNFLIAAAIEATLIDAGFETLIAATPDEAIALIGSRRIGVALIDFRLQHGDPDGLIHQLQTHGVPYLFCTAALSEEVDEMFPGARIVAKPFSDADLLAAISALGQADVPETPADQRLLEGARDA
jgi:DNA-binding response OmpR family regulator